MSTLELNASRSVYGGDTSSAEFALVPKDAFADFFFDVPPSVRQSRITALSAAAFLRCEYGPEGETRTSEIRVMRDSANYVAMCYFAHATEYRYYYSNQATGYFGEPFEKAGYYAVLNGIRVKRGWGNTYVHTSNSGEKPKISLSYDIVTPTVVPDFPAAGGRAIKGLVNRFAWHLDYDATNIVDPIAQASAKLRIRTAGQTAYTEYAVPSGAMYYDLPANTLKADSIEWSVEVATVPGAVSSSAWTTVSTVDDSSSPVCVSPVSEIVTDTDGITFAWQHIIASGSPQTGFELAYSQNAGSSWTTFATGAGAAQSYKAQHGAIPFGSILWRVRTKNSDGTFGSWSSPAYISVTGVPDTPVLSFVGTAPQLKLSWQSSGQQGYQVRIGEFDSGTIFGTAKTYTYNGCLPDGPVTVSVRVANVQGKWSAWASLTAVITNQGSGAITLTTRDGPLAVSLSWATEQTFDYFMVLRDGQPIAKTIDKSYTDALCVGKHQYVVRGMTAGNYTDSETRIAIVTPKHTLISAIDCIDWVHLVYNRGGPPVHSGSLSQSVQLVHYAGRALPVAYTDGTRSGEDQYTFAVRSRLDLSKLQNLIGKTIIIKDWRGDLSTGVLVSVTPDFYTKSIGVKLALDKTDFVEVVEYD